MWSPFGYLGHRRFQARGFIASIVSLSLGVVGVACDDSNPTDPIGLDRDGDDNPGSSLQAIELGTLGGTYGVATAVNDRGDVVGYSETSKGDVHAFLWTAEEGMRDLGTPDGDSRAFGLNDGGEVVGTFEGYLGTMPFLWSDSDGMVDISEHWFGMAFDINDQGHVAGSLEPRLVAAIYTREEGWIESTACPDYSFLYTINDQHEAVGFHQAGVPIVDPDDPDALGPLLSTGVFVSGPGGNCQDLRDDDWYSTQAMGISNESEVAAVAAPSREVGLQVEFLETLQPARLTFPDAIEFAGGSPSPPEPWRSLYEARAINDEGVIVGYEQGEQDNAPPRAFRWPVDGDVTLIEDPDVASTAMDINNRGDVVGWRLDDHGRTQAVLWTDRELEGQEASQMAVASSPRVALRQRSASHPEVLGCPEPLRELVRIRALEECPRPDL